MSCAVVDVHVRDNVTSERKANEVFQLCVTILRWRQRVQNIIPLVALSRRKRCLDLVMFEGDAFQLALLVLEDPGQGMSTFTRLDMGRLDLLAVVIW